MQREAFAAIRAHKKGSRANSRALGFFHNKLCSLLCDLPSQESENYASFARRIGALSEWEICTNILSTATASISTGDSYLPKFKGDALRNYKGALSVVAETEKRNADFARLHAKQLHEIRTTTQQKISALLIEIEKANAQRVAEWISGASNQRPEFDAGTFARIKGATVETSRGAVVPVEHACRLARIARRVIAAGGKEWADGNGPKVGHFTVSAIRADGSATIGCHDFAGAESLRMLALLESCDACATVAEVVGV